jgi:hypothetical protein
MGMFRAIPVFQKFNFRGGEMPEGVCMCLGTLNPSYLLRRIEERMGGKISLNLIDSKSDERVE